MKAREFDPASLTVAAFASAEGQLAGRLVLADLPRLAEDAQPALPPDDIFDWSLRGEQRAQRAAPTQVWLHLRAHGALRMTCQRCLELAPVELDVEQSTLFVHGETQAAELDAESDNDVMALSRSFDAMAWLEDELMLALPAVVRHETCPTALPVQAQADEPVERIQPFKSLAAMKPGS